MTTVRRRLVCRGAVQAVGFRPAVHRLATSLGLGGRVRNDPRGATVEVEGSREAVDRFQRLLPGSLPALARLEDVVVTGTVPLGERTFVVAASREGPRRGALIPPDALPCPACRAEMEDPDDRRHRYPFITCTECGPRFSLARGLPYDRERTSMACFPLCRECELEYSDPASRRFHAEPVCCPSCGPRLWLTDGGGRKAAEGGAALVAARAALDDARQILAIKGLGGFLLACRADDREAVSRLRARKRRPTKPFAVMVPDLEAARRIVRLRKDDEELLLSPSSPIVLAPRSPACPVAREVAPGVDDLGVLLPTTPLHVELFRGLAAPALVMTSANASDEPICRGNREALARLGAIADAFLLHDRDVVRRVDDSVARSTDAGPVLVRRSRGFVPEPIPLPEPAPEPVLALGGHLQATACVAVEGHGFPSQHVGDLDTEAARDFLVEVAEGLEGFLEAEARILVADLHPDYPSAWIAERLAEQRGGRLLRVQHHLAHAAAVLGEHGAFPASDEGAAALILDGTGYGPDETAWGCEWLRLDGSLRWARLARGTPLPLVGGERAVREPWRVAAAALALTDCAERLEATPLATRLPAERLGQVAELARRGRWPLASGAGRLFEAAGALLGLCAENGWEGEAAARLESLAAGADEGTPPWPEVSLPGDGGHEGDRVELPGPALLAEVARRAALGEEPARVAAGFHASFARLATQLTLRVLPPRVRVVALGGGCLVNRILRRRLASELAAAGLRPLLPQSVPPGDGGLAYGQAVLGAVALARNAVPYREGGV